jgi:TPP-dependent trihydroxycyclohexane-1,2-dione (THcHDO) dehydratase
MHIITTLADKTQKKDIIGLVGDQKIVLKNLTNMLEQFESDADIKALLADMKDIAAVYENVTATQTAAVASDKDIISVGNNTAFELSKEQLKSVLEKVESLRNKITL